MPCIAIIILEDLVVSGGSLESWYLRLNPGNFTFKKNCFYCLGSHVHRICTYENDTLQPGMGWGSRRKPSSFVLHWE